MIQQFGNIYFLTILSWAQPKSYNNIANLSIAAFTVTSFYQIINVLLNLLDEVWKNATTTV